MALDPQLHAAVVTLCTHLREDPEYRYAWTANIAMSVYDALRRAGVDHPEAHRACNAGAEEFIRTLTYIASPE